MLDKYEYKKKTKTSRTPDQHGFPQLPRSKQTSFSKVAAVGEELNQSEIQFNFSSSFTPSEKLVQKNSFWLGVDSSPSAVLGLLVLDFLLQQLSFSFFTPSLPQNISFPILRKKSLFLPYNLYIAVHLSREKLWMIDG